MSTNKPTKRDLVAELERADERVERAQERVDEFGEAELQRLADVYRRFTSVLERYEDEVTDDGGDVRTNIEFQSAIAEVTADVSDDLLLSETFEECDEHLQERWFNESHFEYVREQLEPVADLVERIEERDEALEAYSDARFRVRRRVRELEERIDELERLCRLGNADLDAPTERLRDPIEEYNEAVTEAFAEFRREASAREVVRFLDAMDAYPLVPFEQPDEELQSYIRNYPPGEETISTLLEYASYSHSKLDHYVDDPEKLTHVVSHKKTYLAGVDAEPLQVSWPPPSASTLEWRCRELTAAVNRFAPEVVEELRTVASLPRKTDYERLRNSALSRAELTDEERDRIASGDVEAQLAEAREERDRLQEALGTFPER